MSGIIGDVTERKERPAYVTFHRVPIEDKAKSLELGHYVAKDIDYAHITAPYSKDIFKIKVAQWLTDMERDVQLEKLPREWFENYKRSYQAWQNGQELPLNGTAIKGWGVISPAQQETLIRLNILTVEDLAGMNEEGQRRIGMGALELQTKAKAWLSQLTDKGPLTQEIASVRAENNVLKGSVESLQKQVEGLLQMVKHTHIDKPAEYAPEQAITAADLMDDEVQDPAVAYQAKFGKAPHHRMKPESILAALKE